MTLSNFSTGGANRLVFVVSDATQDAANISSVTASGLTFSLIAKIGKGVSQGNSEIWGAWAASQQTNVAVTINYAGAAFPQCAGSTLCLTGTQQSVLSATGASKASAFASGTNPTLTIFTTRPASLVVAAVGTDSAGTITAGSGQTNEGTVGQGVSTVAPLYQNAVTTNLNTPVTMNATLGTAAASGLVVVEVLANTGQIPTTSTDLSNRFNAVQYSNVSADDGDYFIEYGSKYVIEEFKRTWINSTDNINITWTGRSTVSPAVAPVFLQVYNQNTAAWETLADQTVVIRDTDFTLTGSVTANPSNYYDSTRTVSFRVYQQVN